MKNKLKIHLGSGQRPKKRYVTVDLYSKADIKHDLNKFPYPFKNNSAEVIFAKAIFEHLNDLPKVLEECKRILKPNGTLIIESMPHMCGVDRWEDITHKYAVTTRTFRRLEKDNWKKLNMPYDPNFYTAGSNWKNVKCTIKFGKDLQIWNHIIEPLANMFPDIYEQTGIKFMFPCRHIDIQMIK